MIIIYTFQHPRFNALRQWPTQKDFLIVKLMVCKHHIWQKRDPPGIRRHHPAIVITSAHVLEQEQALTVLAWEGSMDCNMPPSRRNCYPVFATSIKKLHFIGWPGQALSLNFFGYWNKGLVLEGTGSQFNLVTGIRFPHYRECCPLICGFQSQLTDI